MPVRRCILVAIAGRGPAGFLHAPVVALMSTPLW